MGRYHSSYTIFKRGKYYYFQTYAPDGTRTSAKTTHQTTKTQARLYCDDLLKRGLLYSGSCQTFGNYARGFFDDNSIWVLDRLALGDEERPGVSLGTLTKYRSALKTILMPYFESKKLQDITPSVVKQFRLYCLNERELSPKTINSAVGVLRIIVNTAMSDNLIMFDPLRGIKNLKEKNGTISAFTLSEAETVLKSPRWIDDLIKHLNLTAALTGMRISEILAIRQATLHPDHIDVNDQCINYEVRPLKTAEKRIVPIPPELFRILYKYCLDSDFAFYHQRQTRPYDHLMMVLEAENIDKKARGLSFHSWRHFLNTYLLSQNVSKVKVDSIIGHTDSQTKVQKLYTHFNGDDYKEIIALQTDLYHKFTGL